MSDKNGKRPYFKRSIETDLLINHYDGMEVGDVTTYKEIEEACGADIRKNWGIHGTATRRLLVDKSKRFETVKTVGVQRLDQSEVIDKSKHGMKRAHRALKRERDKLVYGVTDPDKLTDTQRQDYNTQRSIFEVTIHASKKKTIEKVKRIVCEAGSNPLPVQKTIEALKQ
jgi:hypothetical protein